MSRAEAWLSDAAAVDIVEQARWYEHHSGEDLATRWESEVESALIRGIESTVGRKVQLSHCWAEEHSAHVDRGIPWTSDFLPC
jgi:hypothetical protein